MIYLFANDTDLFLATTHVQKEYHGSGDGGTNVEKEKPSWSGVPTHYFSKFRQHESDKCRGYH